MKLLTKALRRNISRYGETHPTTAQIYNQIGNIYFRQGDWASAAVHYKLAMRCGGGEQLSAAYSNLGTVYWRRGEIETAIDYLHRALTAQPNLDTAGTASIYHQLGVCYALSNDTKNAIESLEKARAIRIRVLGPSDVAVALTNDAIGKVLCMQNKFDEAMACHQQALVCFQNAGIADTSGTWLNIVHVHLAVGNRDAALAALQEACRIQKSVGIDTNKSKAILHVQTLQMMARIYEETGNTTRAEELRLEADLVHKMSGLHDATAEF
jgi:tetratricopeptide (TPR) repeat protein